MISCIKASLCARKYLTTNLSNDKFSHKREIKQLFAGTARRKESIVRGEKYENEG